MNFKLISLIIVVALSILLFLFISYAEFTEGMELLVGGSHTAAAAPVAATGVLSEGMQKAMDAIDKIVQ